MSIHKTNNDLSSLHAMRKPTTITRRPFQTSPPGAMIDQTQSEEERTAPETGSSINSVIAACNKNDRFNLLEDDRALPADLDNPIHPIFQCLDGDAQLGQMLKLASQFLAHDSLLVFFIRLLYGYELPSTVGSTRKTFLSNPLFVADEAKQKRYIEGVRGALDCLAHSVTFKFLDTGKQVYARTMLSATQPKHKLNCSLAFQRKYSARIEVSNEFLNYYHDVDGYAAASRCAQFRHDFLFATTLVHEIVHAVGVMRRGNLREAHICADAPDTEWGYGWEHFMFGSIINPQDKTRPGTNLFMRRFWSNHKSAETTGRRQYYDVPMFYIAQWFQKHTWKVIAEEGPSAISPPIPRFKIQTFPSRNAWIVSSDLLDLKKDLANLSRKWEVAAGEWTSRLTNMQISATRDTLAVSHLRADATS